MPTAFCPAPMDAVLHSVQAAIEASRWDFSGPATVDFCLPGPCRTRRRRLDGRSSPLGLCLGERHGRTQVRFNAHQVLAWMEVWDATLLLPSFRAQTWPVHVTPPRPATVIGAAQWAPENRRHPWWHYAATLGHNRFPHYAQEVSTMLRSAKACGAELTTLIATLNAQYANSATSAGANAAVLSIQAMATYLTNYGDNTVLDATDDGVGSTTGLPAAATLPPAPPTIAENF